MPRRVQRWAAPILMMVLALLAASCSGDGEGGSEDEIVIGASTPLTGSRSEPGEATMRGYEVWEEYVNENGGILDRPVRLIVEDDGSDLARVTSNYQNLIDREQVDLLLGTFSSLQNEPAAAIAEQNQMLYVCPSCGGPSLFEPEHYHFFFAQPAVATEQADLFAEWITGLPEDQRPATAAYPTLDDPFAEPVVSSLREKLEDAGVRTVYNEAPYAEDLDNLEPIANAIRNSGAELVVHGAIGADGINLVNAFQRIGYNPQVLFQTTAPSLGQQYAEGVGPANTEGIFYAVSWSADADFHENAEFVQRYEEKYGTTPPEDAANAFGAAQVVKAAVEGVGSLDDQTALADWLHENTVETLMGPISWDEVGRPQGDFLLAQWQGEQSRIVLPEAVANSDQIIHPKPAWQGSGN